MPSPLHDVWRDYRARRRAVVAFAAAGIPLRWIIASLERITASAGPGHALAAAWATALVAAVAWFAAFRCPFCAAHFHWTWLVSNPFARRCLHCGFERWRDPNAARHLRPGR